MEHMAYMMQTSVQDTCFEITREELDKFCKEYTFTALKGVSFADAFCQHYGLDDFLLPLLEDYQCSVDYIKKWYMNETEVH